MSRYPEFYATYKSFETYKYRDGVLSRQLMPWGKPFQIRLYLVQNSKGDIPLGALEIEMVLDAAQQRGGEGRGG